MTGAILGAAAAVCRPDLFAKSDRSGRPRWMISSVSVPVMLPDSPWSTQMAEYLMQVSPLHRPEPE